MCAKRKAESSSNRYDKRPTICNELLKGITPKNQHQAADFGPALGEEVW